jgi:hypothetical protein
MKDNYRKFLKGKRVAVVGPAKSIENSSNGEKIDNHDIVVRLNYAKIKNPKDSGKRTDVIYYDGSLHNYKVIQPKFVVCSYPSTEWFFNARCARNISYNSALYNSLVVDPDIYKNLKFCLDPAMMMRPNTGLISIVDLLTFDIKSLFITGLDFYRTGYLDTHPDYGKVELNKIKEIFKSGDNGDYHDIERQFEYFKSNIVRDERIDLDDFLKKEINKC